VSDEQPLRVQRDGAVAILTLDRPEKRNALSIALRFALADALDAAAADDGVHAILLTGAGSAFCSGMDVTQFGGDRDHRRRLVASSARAFGALAHCPKPTIVYINGAALAGGFALALLCDVRIADLSARVGFPEIGRHIPPSYAAARAALPEPVARELCLTGRVISAEEARERGVVSAIADHDAALALARQVAAAPPAATREVKRRALLAGRTSWIPLLDDELEQLRAALLGDDEPG
jgi:enoyl-CoA hydratase/carnithine racemase